MNIVHPGRSLRDLPTERIVVASLILGAFYYFRGLPSEREQIVSLICICLLVLTAGRDWRKAAVTVLNWLPFVVLMVLYDFTRGAADDLGMPIQTQLPIVADQYLCGCYATPTLREWIPTTPKGSYPTAYWYEGVFSVTYATHFLLPYLTSAVLWLKDKERFYRFRDTFFLLTFAGLLIYVLVPTTPPWLAGEEGLIPDVDQSTRTVGNGWRILSVTWAESLLDKGRAVSNPVAALPSLHAGYSLFFTLMIWPRAKWSRPILFLFPFVMAITLVITSEHYLFDILLGWVFAAGAVWVFSGDRYPRIRNRVRTKLIDTFGLRLSQNPSEPDLVDGDDQDQPAPDTHQNITV